MFTLLFSSSDVFFCFHILLLFVATKPRENSKKFEKGKKVFSEYRNWSYPSEIADYQDFSATKWSHSACHQDELGADTTFRGCSIIWKTSQICLLTASLFCISLPFKRDMPVLALFFQEVEFGSNQILESSPFTSSYTGSYSVKLKVLVL